MPDLDRFSAVIRECREWRHFLHQNPELEFDVVATAGFVRKKLEEFGCDEVVTGIARTGVVGVIRGTAPGKIIGLRAEMDALPILEAGRKPYASVKPGMMHACGHDGHCAMLLAAAKLLAQSRQFSGSVVLIFQPAEEKGCGGQVMVEDGLMERFGIDSVFGMHNLPGLPVGHFSTAAGPVMAATGVFDIRIRGVGGHAAMPHLTRDALVAAADLVRAMQNIVARRTDPGEPLVLSFTRIAGGESYNIIPEEVSLAGTVRAMTGHTMSRVGGLMQDICDGVALEAGIGIELHFRETCPATVNHARQTRLAAEAAARVCGDEALDRNMQPLMIGEDFSFMLQARPGAFVFIGNGASKDLHHPEYDFNDEALEYGVKYWLSLVRGTQAEATRAEAVPEI